MLWWLFCEHEGWIGGWFWEVEWEGGVHIVVW